METIYRGFKISAKKDQALGGWINTYFYAMRMSDGFFLIDDFTVGADPVQSIIKGIKWRVDEAIRTSGASELIDPEDWAEVKVA